MGKKSTQELLDEFKSVYGIELSIDESKEVNKNANEKLTAMLDLIKSTWSSTDFFRHVLNNDLNSVNYDLGIKQFKINAEVTTLLFLVRFASECGNLELTLLNEMFQAPACQVVQMSATDVVVIKKTSRTFSSEDAKQTATDIYSVLVSETLQNSYISYDAAECYIDDMSESYNNALLAMNIGLTFFADRNIYDYRELGLSTLLYQIPEKACTDYIRNNMPKMDFSLLDTETLNTIRTFMDCDLSIAETARALYLHRNTLVYRLDSFKKQTGLDIRKFDDAVKCQIGLLMWQMGIK